MQIPKLNYFLAAAETENFNKAAALCMVTQPVLSRQIAALEAELGTMLFQREGKKVRLTPAGREYARFAKAAFQQLQEGQQAISEVEAGERGVVTIGSIEPMATTMLPKALAHLTGRYPHLQVEVRVKGAVEVMAEVEEAQLDLGLVLLQPDQAQPSDTLMVQNLFRERLQLIVPPGHSLNEEARLKGAISLERAMQEKLVLLKTGFGVRKAIDRILLSRGYEVDPVVEVDNIESLKEVVRQGVGITFLLPTHFRPEQRNTELMLLALSDVIEEFSFALVYRRFGTLSAASRSFIKLLVEKVAEW